MAFLPRLMTARALRSLKRPLRRNMQFQKQPVWSLFGGGQSPTNVGEAITLAEVIKVTLT